MLLSIGNLTIIRPEALRLARIGGINFHDGPLPDVGGVNTPAWAILRGEREHGITWHWMTDSPDAGGIIAERRFPISDTDTALTLNTRCFELGIETFAEVIEALDQGQTPASRPGTPPRKMVKKSERPPAAGSLEWRVPAVELSALVRGLDFGPYANPLGLAKAYINGSALHVPQLSILDRRAGSPPGTVVAIAEEGLTIATATEDVRIPQFRTLQGEVIPAREAALRFNLREGDLLRILPAVSARLTAAAARVAAHEHWWIRQLARTEPGTLPFPEVAGTLPGEIQSIPVDLSPLPVVPGVAPADVATALTAGVLARLRGRSEFGVLWSDPALAEATEGLEPWLNNSVPVRLSARFEASLDELAREVAATLDEVRKRGTFATDLPVRHPVLRTLPHVLTHTMPIAITVVSEPDRATVRPGSAVHFVLASDGIRGRLFFDSVRLPIESATSLAARLTRLARSFAADPREQLGRQSLLSDAERRDVLVDWNATQLALDPSDSIDGAVRRHAEAHPDRVAVAAQGVELTWRELDARIDSLAAELRRRGVGPDGRVAVMVERDVNMPVVLLAVIRAGGAYVPLDPEYPAERLELMLSDSAARVLVVNRGVAALPAGSHETLVLEDVLEGPREAEPLPPSGAGPEHLAYVIYTSGSTGRPKGVMVERRNVLNFFAAMDQRLGTTPGAWLAVTSISFDISVLELLWTLARGYTVVVHREGRAVRVEENPSTTPSMSLFYFASADSGSDRYRLLLDGARFADARGFEAIWTPERHFHAFGGIYPNPSVTSAAVAAVTRRVAIRGGSVVLPLHHPARVAEEWSVVDNISGGRVGIAFASGWQPNDFVLRPESYAENKRVMLRDLEVVRKLWRGEEATFPGVNGQPVTLRTLPRPVQPELPIWLTAAGNTETYRIAGTIGANVLTHLLGQSIEELGAKLAVYRQAWRAAGHPGQGRVTLMLHTFVGTSDDGVKEAVRTPLLRYLESSVDLIRNYAWSFPALKRRAGDQTDGTLDIGALSETERSDLLSYAFERYYETSGLFGTPETCLTRIDQLAAAGVDEIACLIDFGVESSTVLEHLEDLDRLRILAGSARRAAAPQHGLASLIARYGITHLQCTPSLARMLLADAASRAGLAALEHLLLGGEALPEALANEVRSVLRTGRLHNMYGPTETTVWSTMHDVGADERPVLIGQPIANTQVYVLDGRGEPLPAGVPGELYIGGAGVTRGYLGQEELTAQRFVPDRFTGRGRLYRTGDRARWRADGRLEFLGRLDQQVKVNGHRIELGEIEAQLALHPDVRDVAVLAREDRPGDARLVAYVVYRGAPTDAAGLRSWLRRKVPDFMVPSLVVNLDRLPTTPNGKVDRRALPEPSTVSVAAPSVDSRPASPVEEQIAGIWRDLLQVTHVSRDANFFDLGGHSLLAVQVHRRLRELMPERPLTITDLFRYPTVTALAGYLGGGNTGDTRLQDVAARGEARRSALQRRTRRGGAGA